jgi:hypothetical protein
MMYQHLAILAELTVDGRDTLLTELVARGRVRGSIRRSCGGAPHLVSPSRRESELRGACYSSFIPSSTGAERASTEWALDG